MRKRRKTSGLKADFLFRFGLLVHQWIKIEAKGIGVIGAAAGGGGGVCLDCGGNYTEEELDVSLIVLSLILSVFLLILCSQCFYRIRARLSNNEKNKGMPPPPYIRRCYSYTV